MSICVCPSLCVYHHKLIHAITHNPFKLDHQHLVKVPVDFFGGRGNPNFTMPTFKGWGRSPALVGCGGWGTELLCCSLLFGAIHWSRQPRVFRCWTSLLFNLPESFCSKIYNYNPDCKPVCFYYRKVSNIRRTLVGNKIVDHSVVVGALPVGAAPTTSSFWHKHMASMDWTKRRRWIFKCWDLVQLILEVWPYFVVSVICQPISSLLVCPLTHWGTDKMADISQKTYSNEFSWMKVCEYRLKFHWSLFLRVQLTISQHWFR